MRTIGKYLPIWIGVLVFSTLLSVSPADAQTVRSTRYTGDDYIRHSHQPEYNQLEITLEAWIYKSTSGCHTLMSHGRFGDSFKLLACTNLGFTRSSGVYAWSDATVPVGNWTHIAVSYDGATARFFVDGAAAGEESLTSTGPLITQGDLLLGVTQSQTGNLYGWLNGYMDEVRIHSSALDATEIADGRTLEVRTAPSLVAAFGDGGLDDELSTDDPIAADSPVASSFGQLPTALEVPSSLFPNFDGRVFLGGEYAGAEKMVIRYPDSLRDDGVAYLTHDDQYLYIGIPAQSLAAPGAQSHISVFVDQSPLGGTWPQTTDFHFATYTTQGTERFYQGTGTFPMWSQPCVDGSQSTSWCSAHQPEAIWRCEDGDDVCLWEEKTVEIRIPEALIGSFEQPARLALRHSTVPVGNSNPSFIAPVTATATTTRPQDWAPLNFTGSSVTHPRAVFFGRVFEGISPNSNGPIGGHEVFVSANNTILATTTSDSTGWFNFGLIEVPQDAPLNVGINYCSGCQITEPVVDSNGTQANFVGANYVQFPGCSGGICNFYARTDFFVLPSLDPLTLSHATDPAGQPSTSGAYGLDISATESIAGEHRRLHGANIHPYTQVFLGKPDPWSDDPLDWDLYPAPVVDRADDYTWIDVELPHLGSSAPALSNLVWVVENQWLRPGHSQWIKLDDPAQAFDLHFPSYPQVWGFGWVNRKPKNWWNAVNFQGFLATYGDNAIRCVGLGDWCVNVVDPIYGLIYYPIYAIARRALPKSCFGMAGSSLQLYNQQFTTAELNPSGDVYFPAGFTELDNNSLFNCPSFECRARNPAGLVQSNHGKQVSVEALSQYVVDLTDSGSGDPLARLAEVEAGLMDTVLCLYNHDNRRKGHCVTPYEVRHPSADESEIWVYDNNHPNDPRVITIDRVANTYDYSGTSEHKHGKSMVTYPRSIFSSSGAHFPLDVFGLLEMVIMGGDASNADLTAAPGTFTSLELPLLGAEAEEEVTAQMVQVSTDHADLRLMIEEPDMQMVAGRDERVFSLSLRNATVQTEDRVELSSNPSGQLQSLVYKPQAAHGQSWSKIGLRPTEDETVVFIWSGLEVGDQERAEFEIVDTPMPAVSYRNGTADTTQHDLLVEMVAGSNDIAETLLFENIDVPREGSQTVTLEGWPKDLRLRSDIDLDGDGTVDVSSLLDGISCTDEGLEDCDDNGRADVCDLASGMAFDDDGDGVLDVCRPAF